MQAAKVQTVPSHVGPKKIRIYTSDRSTVVDINPGQVIYTAQFPGGRQPREGEKDGGNLLGTDVLIHMEIVTPGGCFKVFTREEAKVACALLGVDQVPMELPYPSLKDDKE